jgi:aldehyde dehydrogenase (NAD+)
MSSFGISGEVSSLLIDGVLRPATGERVFSTANPATEQTLGHAADAGSADLDAAVAAARRAFDDTDWSRDTALRVRCIRQLRDALQANADELRAVTVAEAGSPVMLTRGPQLDGPVADLAFAADLAESYAWEADLGVAAPMGVRSRRILRREPIGVVAAITPWNFPHQITLAKLGPALAAGNTVVLKPAPDTPWCAAALGRIVAEHADFPPGVLNIVTSADHGIGAQLVADPRVDLVSFTGSTATGKTVMALAAQSVTKVFLELGGKSAAVVLDDADLAAACSVTAFSVCLHAGQGCALTTRLLVPRERYDEAVELAAKTLSGIRPGDPANPATVCGPLISARQRDRVERYLALAETEGARIVVGGSRPADRPAGYFVEPTLLADLPNTATAVQEEIFGPVLAILPHYGDADAVVLANQSPYGLSGAVWGGDPARIERVVAGMRTGTIAVNGGVWYSADAPFGGYKQSGIGREMGVSGFEEYLETKLVATAQTRPEEKQK